MKAVVTLGKLHIEQLSLPVPPQDSEQLLRGPPPLALLRALGYFGTVCRHTDSVDQPFPADSQRFTGATDTRDGQAMPCATAGRVTQQ